MKADLRSRRTECKVDRLDVVDGAMFGVQTGKVGYAVLVCGVRCDGWRRFLRGRINLVHHDGVLGNSARHVVYDAAVRYVM